MGRTARRGVARSCATMLARSRMHVTCEVFQPTRNMAVFSVSGCVSGWGSLYYESRIAECLGVEWNPFGDTPPLAHGQEGTSCSYRSGSMTAGQLLGVLSTALCSSAHADIYAYGIPTARTYVSK